MRLQERSASASEPHGQAYWGLNLFPSAGEASGTLRFAYRPRRGARGRRGAAQDAERSKVEAGRRAKGKVRRYCAANRLSRLGTLTYRGEGCHDPRQFRRDVGRFFRRLRQALDVDSIPYVWVPEWHKSGHGLHGHFAVGRYIAHPLIAEAWGLGFVHIKQLGQIPDGPGAMAEARIAAGYLAKYVGKTFDEAQIEGLHRYEVAQGYQPATHPITGSTVAEVLDAACEVMDGQPGYVWHSDEVDDWHGPPAVWASWPG